METIEQHVRRQHSNKDSISTHRRTLPRLFAWERRWKSDQNPFGRGSVRPEGWGEAERGRRRLRFRRLARDDRQLCCVPLPADRASKRTSGKHRCPCSVSCRALGRGPLRTHPHRSICASSITDLFDPTVIPLQHFWAVLGSCIMSPTALVGPSLASTKAHQGWPILCRGCPSRSGL